MLAVAIGLHAGAGRAFTYLGANEHPCMVMPGRPQRTTALKSIAPKYDDANSMISMHRQCGQRSDTSGLSLCGNRYTPRDRVDMSTKPSSVSGSNRSRAGGHQRHERGAYLWPCLPFLWPLSCTAFLSSTSCWSNSSSLISVISFAFAARALAITASISAPSVS